MPLVRKGASPPPTTSPDQAAEKLLIGSADERWAAARDLAGRPEGVSALAEALKEETDGNVREAILTSLARSGGPAAVEAILPLVRSDEAGLRTAALDALRLMPQALAEHLDVVLTDADTDVRILACDLARQLPGPLATRLLSGVLLNDPHANVCAAAVDVLAEAGDRDALPALAACEARFPASPFLAFAIGVVRQRIDAAPERRG
jgi:HEAT repeat protein